MLRAAVISVLLLVARATVAGACSQLPPCEELAALTSLSGIDAKLSAKDGGVAAKAALALARSDQPARLKAVGRALRDPAVLARIVKADGRCSLPAILRALAANPAAQARKEFIGLIAAKAWREDPDRSDGADRMSDLLRATAALRPSAPEVIAMWKAHAKPDDGWVNVTTMVLAESGTPEAVALWELLLADNAYDTGDRVAWLHSSFVGVRDQPAMLDMAARLIDAKLPAELQTAVVESVFDYQQRWFGLCGGPPKPDFARYSAAAQKSLRAVATKARAKKLAKEQKAAIDAALAELPKP